MVWRSVMLAAFMSGAVRCGYQEATRVAPQPMVVVRGGEVNPRPECYQVYQPSLQTPFCAAAQQSMTTGVIMPQKQDPSLKLNNDLIRLIRSIPTAAEKLSSFLEYNGITTPWPEIFDFTSDKQHNMPAPEPMFSKIQLLLGGLESIKEFISNELFKIEKYVRRGKAYLVENIDDLRRYHSILREYLRKMETARTAQAKNDYASKFSALHGKTQEKIKSYLELRTWLQTTVRLFRSLF